MLSQISQLGIFCSDLLSFCAKVLQSTQGVSVWNYPKVRDHLNVCLREVLEDVQDVAVNLRSRQYQVARKWIDSIGRSVVLEAVSLNVTAEIDRLDQPSSWAREKSISQSTY